MKVVTALIAFVLLFFYTALAAFAVAPTMTSYPDTITADNSFSIQATMSGLSKNTVYRLRMALAQMGTANYFGSTHNGTDWYNGTPSPIDYSKFLSITTNQDGAWFGEILGKFTGNDPNYTNVGSGNYDLKIGRYTESGSTATWSNIVQVSLIAPTPNPTPTPTQASTPIPTSTPTLTPTPTKAPTIILKSTIKAVSPTESLNADVLGQSTKSSTPKPTQAKKNDSKNSKIQEDNLLPKVFILIGVAFLALCGIVISYPSINKWRKERFNG